MSNFSKETLIKKTFIVNHYSDFDNIPLDTQSLIIKITFLNDHDYSPILNNLPIFLQEIHFDNKHYILDETQYQNMKKELLQSATSYRIAEYKIKIPFGCKIYKFKEEILNFDDLIKIYYEDIRLQFNHPINELIW